MNILYYSCHDVLEDDEVSLLRNLGHDVFVLGTRTSRDYKSPYRPFRRLSEQENILCDRYESLGGVYGLPFWDAQTLPDGFADYFDAVIVMHQAEFINIHWNKLAHAPVIWRTIGQNIDEFEQELRIARENGLWIVRYSATEENKLGTDALIRFYKNPNIYCKWKGESKCLLNFTGSFASRYPVEGHAFNLLSERIPCVTAGSASEFTFRNGIGFKTYEEQIELYRSHRAYLYLAGLHIPYTLNFIEAWMTGIPMVVLAPYDRIGPYFEIDKLIEDGRDGYVCRDLDAAEKVARLLFDDYEAAQRIGEAGRKRAIQLFGPDTIAAQWSELLQMTKTGDRRRGAAAIASP